MRAIRALSVGGGAVGECDSEDMMGRKRGLNGGSEGEGTVGPGFDVPQGGNLRERSLVWVYTTEDESASVLRSLDLKTTQMLYDVPTGVCDLSKT